MALGVGDGGVHGTGVWVVLVYMVKLVVALDGVGSGLWWMLVRVLWLVNVWVVVDLVNHGYGSHCRGKIPQGRIR